MQSRSMELQFVYQNGPIGKFICFMNLYVEYIYAKDDDDHNSVNEDDNLIHSH